MAITHKHRAMREAAGPGNKFCCKCKVAKPLGDFTRTGNSRKRIYSSRCKTCLNEQQRLSYPKRREKAILSVAEHTLKTKYGKPPGTYAAMLAGQNGVCAICKTAPTDKTRSARQRLSIDHSHATGELRGLLCQPCNTGIGLLRESPELLDAAKEYLRRYS